MVKKCLDCSDIEGINNITLTEVKFRLNNELKPIITIKSNNNFACIEYCPELFPREAQLIEATFIIDFLDSIRSRSIKIVPPNVTAYTHDADSILVEKWLKARGFENEYESS